jgi:hypothetical protein
MYRISSILILIIFASYSFTFKSHYCYNHDGTRFHGDCTAYLKNAEKNNKLSTSSVHEQRYVCYDVQLNKQYQQQDYSIKSLNDFLFELPPIPELPVVVSLSQPHAIPLFSCRGGPPLFTELLRGPPSC